MRLTLGAIKRLDDPEWLVEQLRRITAENEAPKAAVTGRGLELAVLSRTTLIGLIVTIAGIEEPTDLLECDKVNDTIIGALSLAYAMGLQDGEYAVGLREARAFVQAAIGQGRDRIVN